MLESLPAPLQLGIIGFLLLTIASILIWQNRQVQTGKLVPAETVAALLKGKDDTIASLEKISAGKDVAIREWRDAHTVSEQGRAEERAVNEGNAEAIRLVGYFFQQVAPKRDIPPVAGDNATVEGSR
jgi:hypothetical protein